MQQNIFWNLRISYKKPMKREANPNLDYPTCL